MLLFSVCVGKDTALLDCVDDEFLLVNEEDFKSRRAVMVGYVIVCEE